MIIIGAGAAGLFAAANIRPGKRVLLLEKTAKPGQKLLLTGSGQCNLTNAGSIADFLPRYGPNGKRLRPVLFPFSNLALMGWLEAQCLPLTTRSDGKVFPASMDARDVLNLLLGLARKNGVEIRYNTPVTALAQTDDNPPARFRLATPAGTLYTQNVLVATGGASYPRTGSDGAFFGCLDTMGLNLTPRRPALCPVYVHDYPYGELSGISFPDCAIVIDTDNKPVRARDSLLLTHRGFSGLVILNNARHISQGAELTISCLPNTDLGDLRRALLTAAAGTAQQVGTLLEAKTRLPRRFLEAVCHRINIPPDTKAARLGGAEMGQLATLLTADTHTVSGTGGFQTAMVTAGGVSLDEIDLPTMSARRFPGLYFAGEVVDIDGDTGGYNLQFAFSSARLAVSAL